MRVVMLVLLSGSCLVVLFVLLEIEILTSSKSALSSTLIHSHLTEFRANPKPHRHDDSSKNNNSNQVVGNGQAALKRPFQIFQLGDPRSASTFQFELVCSMATWKTRQQTDRKKIPCRFIKYKQMENARFHRKLQESVDSNQTFVYKAHNDPGILKELALSSKVAVFSSGGVGSSFALYTQDYVKLQQCLECEIDRYQPFFQLSPLEIVQLKSHMNSFGIIRRCCGLQMSKYEMQRLHGCNVTMYRNRSSYPNCEQYSTEEMRATEDALAESPVPFRFASPEYNWEKPGDCARFKDEIVMNGKGFNGKPFVGCVDL